jgi:hypothetical protein
VVPLSTHFKYIYSKCQLFMLISAFLYLFNIRRNIRSLTISFRFLISLGYLHNFLIFFLPILSAFITPRVLDYGYLTKREAICLLTILSVLIASYVQLANLTCFFLYVKFGRPYDRNIKLVLVNCSTTYIL